MCLELKVKVGDTLFIAEHFGAEDEEWSIYDVTVISAEPNEVVVKCSRGAVFSLFEDGHFAFKRRDKAIHFVLEDLTSIRNSVDRQISEWNNELGVWND